MIAVIAGETYRFRPFIDLYREAGDKAGHAPDELKVGSHFLGYVAETSKKAVNEYFPGYAEAFTRIGRERGWPPVTRNHFNAQAGPYGALMVGNPEELTWKIMHHSESLGGISIISFQKDNAALSHDQLQMPTS